MRGKRPANKGIKMPTVGEAALKLQESSEKINPIELQQAIHKGNTEDDSFESNVIKAVERGKRDLAHKDNFFIVVLFKKERILHNVLRQYFFPRISCPTPEWDQIVYKYHAKEERLEFLWVVPDKDNCYNLAKHKKHLPLDQQPLCEYSSDFLSGKLDERCKVFNGELRESGT